MAINYSAGFLPQALYSNMMQTQRDGLAEANQRERDRWSQLGQLGAAFVKGNINMGDKAQEAYTKNYDIQRKRLTDTMAKLDPRSGDYENYKNAIANLDSEYTNKMQDFQESGFLGNLGRDRDMLSELTNYEPGSYSPDSTAAAYALTDDQTKYQNKRAIDLDVNPKIAGAEKTAQLEAVANETIRQFNDPTFKAMKAEERKNALDDELTKIEARGDIQLANTQLQVAAQEAARQGREAEAKRLNDFRMKLLEKESENRLTMADREDVRLERRFELENELLGKKAEGKSELTPKQALELRGKIQEETMAELGIFDMADLVDDPDKKAEYDALLRKKNNEMASLYPGYKLGNQSSESVPAPTAADFGVGTPTKKQPRLGEGFITPAIVEGYQGQLDSLLENADRLTGSDGKPIFKDLQKQIDSLQVEAESLNKQIRSAKTTAEKNEAIGKLNSIVPRIYQLNTELFQRAESRRKGNRILGSEMNAVPGSAMNYIPPGA
jgi:hypothetical protein